MSERQQKNMGDKKKVTRREAKNLGKTNAEESERSEKFEVERKS